MGGLPPGWRVKVRRTGEAPPSDRVDVLRCVCVGLAFWSAWGAVAWLAMGRWTEGVVAAVLALVMAAAVLVGSGEDG